MRKRRRNLQTTFGATTGFFGATRSLSTAASWERFHPIRKPRHEGCNQTVIITVDIQFERIFKLYQINLVLALSITVGNTEQHRSS